MLEIIFAVLQTLWKHHKSKDQTILHRSYTQKKISTPKKIYFFRVQKKSKTFRKFFGRKFFDFFELEKKYFFSELRNVFGYSFDVKLSELLIYDVFRAFGVRQIWFPVPTRYCEGTKTCSISRVFSILMRNQPFSPLFHVSQKKSNFFWVRKKNIFFRSWKKSWGIVSM